jgi:hypothetical protein
MADTPQKSPLLEIEIIIGEDGEVVFPDLNADLLDVALALDPDSDLSCRRAPQGDDSPEPRDTPRDHSDPK